MGPTRIEGIIPAGREDHLEDQEEDGKIILTHNFGAWTVRIGPEADPSHT